MHNIGNIGIMAIITFLAILTIFGGGQKGGNLKLLVRVWTVCGMTPKQVSNRRFQSVQIISSEIANLKSEDQNALGLARRRRTAIFNDFGGMEAGWLA